MKKSLYNIESEYFELLEEIEQAEGELTPEQEERLKINESELKDKAISYLAVITSNEEENKTIDEEIKRLQALKKSNSKLIDKLKSSILSAVRVHGNFTSGLTKFGTRKSTRLEISDEAIIPAEFIKVKEVRSIDKAAITKNIKLGVEFEGCELVENLNLKIN